MVRFSMFKFMASPHCMSASLIISNFNLLIPPKNVLSFPLVTGLDIALLVIMLVASIK
jgi:hypothetical protein